ncbi:MAG TPA: methylated-DNA--[protein]-cysteine S-methyltransferase [Pseudolabrys sp.]|nr:methylated-DNA--[protein]-cysteine S-methyltransferase [Pseudolabrys sp.]
MPALDFTIFDTAIGACGIVWSGRGVYAVQLPEATRDATRTRLIKRYPQALEAQPPSAIRGAIDGIVALLAGEPRDLAYIVIDDEGTATFNKRVYAIARKIPPGETLTYGEIAARLGDKSLSRAVGQALGENPCPIVMPCHRVLAANGKTGGFSAAGGVAIKLKILSIENAQPNGPTLFDRLPLAARRS